MKQSARFKLFNDGVYRLHGHGVSLICGHIDILSRFSVAIPATAPQSWLILGFRSRGGIQKQAMVLDSVLLDEHFWSLLGDLYKEDFPVTRGCEEQVRGFLQDRCHHIHEFELNQTLPVSAVYLSTNRSAWAGLYEDFVGDQSPRHSAPL